MVSNQTDDTGSSKKCAINFFGLPRAYSSLVLPSIVKNVIVPNAKHGCDYFVHFYALEHEMGGRSGLGGALYPDQIYLLEREVKKQQTQQNAHTKPVVQFVVEQEEEFWKKYTALLDKINHTKDEKTNKLLYFPFKAQTYKKQTMDNIIKMWHSIQEAWKLMERYGQGNNIVYEQVAMLRSDVVYMTPIDLYEYAADNKIVVPGFGRYPVNDRSVIGPAKGVEVWATGRFDRIEEHVQFMKNHHFGWGLHEERFLSYTLFPAIQKAMMATAEDTSTEKDEDHDPTSSSKDSIIVEHPTMCFMRARADETVWTSDCKVNAQKSIVESLLNGGKSLREVVEQVIGRTCPGEAPVKIKANVWALDCHSKADK